MIEIVLATANPGKIQEIRQIMEGPRVRFVTKDELDEWPEIVESGATYLENALIKAEALVALTGRAALADDSGIEIDALGGAPGVWSARFAGPEADDELNNRKMAQMLDGVAPPDRSARYRCWAVVVLPDGRRLEAEGVCEGSIATRPAGENGFGYDPWFIPAGQSQTFGQLPLDFKHGISHRGEALRKLAAQLDGELLA